MIAMDSWGSGPTDTSQFAKFVNNAANPADVREQRFRAEEAEAKQRFDRLTEQMEYLAKQLKEASKARDAIPAKLLRHRTTKHVGAVLGVSSSRVGQMKQRYLKEHRQ